MMVYMQDGVTHVFMKGVMYVSRRYAYAREKYSYSIDNGECESKRVLDKPRQCNGV